MDDRPSKARYLPKPMIMLAALALAQTPFAAQAESEAYVLDSSHSQVLFTYNHLGFSTTYNMFSGFEGEVQFDQDDPGASSVSVSIPVMSMFTGWEKRLAHFMSDDFFGADDDDMITFESTAIEVTGDDTALITGDLTMNDITQSVVLDAKLNKADVHPMSNKDWLGFDATTSLLRSDFGLDKAAPAVSDEVEVQMSIEASKG